MKKVLIVEDEKNIRIALGKMLNMKGYDVFMASNGKEGLEQILLKSPDLVLCDINMPEMDGFEVLRVLKNKLKDTPPPPFIYLTAKVEREDIRHGMNLGATDYITKPFTVHEVLEAIESKLIQHSVIQNAAVTAERSRIAQELHNNIQQLLVVARLNLETVAGSKEHMSTREIQSLEESHKLIHQAIIETRRVSHDIGEPEKEWEGIENFIQNILNRIKLSGRVDCDFSLELKTTLDEALQIMVCSIIQELINNTLKHANANKITLAITDSQDKEVIVRYYDNGIGYNIEKVKPGFGLSCLSNKVKNIGGFIDFDSKVGEGSHCVFVIPKNKKINDQPC